MKSTEEMLRMIMNNLSTFKQEILTEIKRVDKKLTARIDAVNKELTDRIDGVEKNLSGRIDKLGKQLAYLEEDAPTREEFSELEKRVDKIEHKTPAAL